MLTLTSQLSSFPPTSFVKDIYTWTSFEENKCEMCMGVKAYVCGPEYTEMIKLYTLICTELGCHLSVAHLFIYLFI